MRLGQREDAEDATQIVFLRATESLQNCRDDSAFVGWLYAIARNVITDKQRMRKSNQTRLGDDDEIEDANALPEELAIRSVQRDELREARAHCLNDQERELFDLLVQDLTYKEMATALGKRVGAIRTRYWRLLDRLRSCLSHGTTREGGVS
jgi:RNA polymerase sigma-70 factor (ECF subfamily)